MESVKHKTASQQITEKVTSWPGVESGTGSRGEFAFTFGRHEIGHLHGDRVAHFYFPREMGSELREQGRVGPHPVAPKSPKLASRQINSNDDVLDVIELMRLNYDRITGGSKTVNTEKTIMKNRYPDITRPDAKITLVSKWKVKNPEHQKMAGDAAIDVWKNMPWPDGLISHTVYLGHDHVTVLQYSQWISEQAIDVFKRNNLEDRAEVAHQTVPGLERVEAVIYRHYQSMISEKSAGSQPGCIILVSFEADGPEWQSQFVDTLIDTVENSENPHHPGSIASHFHFSMDGKRVLNYAEFTNREAHEEVVQAMLQNDGEIPRLIRSLPGITPLGFERFSFHKSINS